MIILKSLSNFCRETAKFIPQCEFSKETKKNLLTHSIILEFLLQVKFIFKISHIYDGNCVSLICEAQEILIEDTFQKSVFDEYSDAEEESD